jgi:uncharacterized protein
MGENPFSAAAYERALSEGRLVGTLCKDCGAVYLPPRAICPACQGCQMEWVQFSGRGVLAAFSVVYVAPSEMIAEGYGRDTPYCAGVVRLEEGPAISAQILGVDVTHPETIAVGAPVRAVTLRRGRDAGGQARLAFTPGEP